MTVGGSSIMYGLYGGVAYSFIKDIFSISVGARYVIAEKSAILDGNLYFHTEDNETFVNAPSEWNLKLESEYYYNAEGYTPIFGLNIQLFQKFTVAFRYEMETDLKFIYDEKKNNVTCSNEEDFTQDVLDELLPTVKQGLSVAGKVENANLPKIIAFGIEYEISPNYTVSTSGTIYYLGTCDMGGYEENFDKGLDAAIGITFRPFKKTTFAFSFLYTDLGQKKDIYKSKKYINATSPNPPMTTVTFSGGLTYHTKYLDFTFSGSYVSFDSLRLVNESGYTIGYDKSISCFAVGVSYHAFHYNSDAGVHNNIPM